MKAIDQTKNVTSKIHNGDCVVVDGVDASGLRPGDTALLTVQEPHRSTADGLVTPPRKVVVVEVQEIRVFGVDTDTTKTPGVRRYVWASTPRKFLETFYAGEADNCLRAGSNLNIKEPRTHIEVDRVSIRLVVKDCGHTPARGERRERSPARRADGRRRGVTTGHGLHTGAIR